MRKLLFSFVIFIFVSFCIYAGDVANFVNLGFSKDGSFFAFGQYGLTDQTYRAYGEICCIDVEKNTFVPSGKFITSPTSETSGKDSKDIFLNLLDRASFTLKNRQVKEENAGRSVYSANDSTIGENVLLFRDFETNDEYKVILHKERKSPIEVSFYISVEIIKPNGSIIKKEVGQKSYIRSGIKDYAIKKIIIDNTNTSLAFIIEKHEYNKKGTSIRYMAETIKL